MSKKAQNIFLIFGLAVLAVMVSQLDFQEVWEGVSRAGYWFIAVVVLWGLLYILNAAAWYIILNAPKEDNAECRMQNAGKVSFAQIYKLTVSGFALNYATPGGLMGGEPYRIMSISPYVGTERATSSVVLYAMTHMFSHFWFWALSIVLLLVMLALPTDIGMKMTTELAIILAASAVFCGLGLWFFMAGYRKGLANRVLGIARHIPLLKRWAKPFVDSHKEQLDTIDRQIAGLHSQNPRIFVAAVLLELLCRVLSAYEIYFVMLVFMPQASIVQCILILAFTSLFANLLFFIPLQIGGREGGFLMSVTAFGISSTIAIFVALIVRLNELVWTAIGLALIKVGNKAHTD